MLSRESVRSAIDAAALAGLSHQNIRTILAEHCSRGRNPTIGNIRLCDAAAFISQLGSAAAGKHQQ